MAPAHECLRRRQADCGVAARVRRFCDRRFRRLRFSAPVDGWGGGPRRFRSRRLRSDRGDPCGRSHRVRARALAVGLRNVGDDRRLAGSVGGGRLDSPAELGAAARCGRVLAAMRGCRLAVPARPDAARQRAHRRLRDRRRSRERSRLGVPAASVAGMARDGARALQAGCCCGGAVSRRVSSRCRRRAEPHPLRVAAVPLPRAQRRPGCRARSPRSRRGQSTRAPRAG